MREGEGCDGYAEEESMGLRVATETLVGDFIGNIVRSGHDITADPRADILLVDDHPNNLLALEAMLAELGQSTVRAQSGAEALKCLLAQDFAVILLDVQMPG